MPHMWPGHAAHECTFYILSMKIVYDRRKASTARFQHWTIGLTVEYANSMHAMYAGVWALWF